MEKDWYNKWKTNKQKQKKKSGTELWWLLLEEIKKASLQTVDDWIKEAFSVQKKVCSRKGSVLQNLPVKSEIRDKEFVKEYHVSEAHDSKNSKKKCNDHSFP